MIKRILVALDGSEASDLALQKVLENVNKEETTIAVVYVIVPSTVVPFGGRVGVCEGVMSDHSCDELMKQDEELMQKKISLINEDYNGTIQLLIRLGEPRSEILAAAQEFQADLIVLGSTGKGLGKRLLLGSVSTYIVTHSPISTLVVR